MRLLIIAVFLATMLLLAALFILTDRALSVPASPPPASAEWVGWAKRWHGQAVRARRAYARVRRCQGRAAPRPIAALPARCESKHVWSAAGSEYKHLAKRLRKKHAEQLHRMKHPGGSGASRWRALALYAGWPRSSWPQLAGIIRRESGGDPRAVNHYSGCAGLLQLHPCHGVANVFDPLVNLRAGLRLYRAAGWQPWGM